jgi:uncharacterized cupin superfamily protein
MKKSWNGVAFVLGIVAGRLMSSTALPQFRTVKTTRLLTTALEGWCAGKEMTIELNDISPGTSGRHYHPAHSFTYVFEGSEIYTVDGETPNVVHAGECSPRGADSSAHSGKFRTSQITRGPSNR